MSTLADVKPATIRCRIDVLTVGDEVLTPAHRWKTVTGLDRGKVYSRSTRVATDATGPDHPYVWVNRHTVLTRRRNRAGTS